MINDKELSLSNTERLGFAYGVLYGLEAALECLGAATTSKAGKFVFQPLNARDYVIRRVDFGVENVFDALKVDLDHIERRRKKTKTRIRYLEKEVYDVNKKEAV